MFGPNNSAKAEMLRNTFHRMGVLLPPKAFEGRFATNEGFLFRSHMEQHDEKFNSENNIISSVHKNSRKILSKDFGSCWRVFLATKMIDVSRVIKYKFNEDL